MKVHTLAAIESTVLNALLTVFIIASSALRTSSNDFEEVDLERIKPTAIRAKEERDSVSTLRSRVRHEDRRSWNTFLVASLTAGRGTLFVLALLLGTKYANSTRMSRMLRSQVSCSSPVR